MILAKASLNYDHSFIVLATIITLVNYNCKTFIVQATGHNVLKLLMTVIYECS
jgi:hypothetical protein